MGSFAASAIAREREVKGTEYWMYVALASQFLEHASWSRNMFRGFANRPVAKWVRYLVSF